MPLPQVFPEGMHMFQLPFMDDIRSPELEGSVVGPEVRGGLVVGPEVRSSASGGPRGEGGLVGGPEVRSAVSGGPQVEG